LNGFILILPIIFIRYGIVSFFGKQASKRTTFFPPRKGKEKLAYWIYEITTLLMIIVLFFNEAILNNAISFIGLAICFIGMILYAISIVHFAKPNKNGLNITGIYKISRNPMYIAFFLYFLGASILIHSWILFFILVIFQISVHYLIISEERWCIEQFGEEYIYYMKKVRRYI